jgi:hypothetical protein
MAALRYDKMAADFEEDTGGGVFILLNINTGPIKSSRSLSFLKILEVFGVFKFSW